MGKISMIIRKEVLYINYYHGYKQFRISTGIHTDHTWKGTTPPPSHPNYTEIVNSIQDHLKPVETIVKRLKHEGREPTVERVKSILRGTEGNIHELFNKWMNERCSNNNLSDSTRRNYHLAGHKLRLFLKKNFKISDVKISFLKDFSEFLYETMNDGGVNKRIQVVKLFFKWCREQEHIGFAPDIECKDHRGTVVYLSKSELESFENVQVESKAKDIFLFCCYSSLAYCDYIALTKNVHWIDKDFIIIPGRRKSSTTQVIPLRDKLREVLYRLYPDMPTLANQVMNRKLKEIAKLAGIKDLVTIKKYRRGKPIYQTYPKWKLITTHTARKTFATLALHSGIDMYAVMQAGGWKDVKSMEPYKGEAQKNYLMKEFEKWK